MKRIYFVVWIFILFNIIGCDYSKDTPTPTKKQQPIPVSPPKPIIYGTVEDIDGNIYKTIKVGKRSWMAENLKVTHFNSGEPIPIITDPTSMASFKKPAMIYPNLNAANEKDTYGALYNGYTLQGGYSSYGWRDLCPTDWYVASVSDWEKLITEVGGKEIAGGKLKNAIQENWNNENIEASDEIGFNALPAGTLQNDGKFYLIGYSGLWWTSYSSTAYMDTIRTFYSVSCFDKDLYRENFHDNIGLSVRCVK